MRLELLINVILFSRTPFTLCLVMPGGAYAAEVASTSIAYIACRRGGHSMLVWLALRVVA